MNAKRRFEELKKLKVESGERSYGQEARALYGDDMVDRTNDRLLALGEKEWCALEDLEGAVKEQLRHAMSTDDPESEQSRTLACMHERWIKAHWGNAEYSPEAHLGLARMYLDDPRFKAYYDDAAGEGATAFLVRALEAHLS